MSDFITDVEQQYEVYCKIAEDYGFIDFNAKKNGFRCTTKSNEFNAGWIAFTGAIAAMREDQQAKIDQLKSELALCREENKGLVGKVSEQQKRVGFAFTEFEMFAGYLCEHQPQGGDFITETLLMHGRVLKALRGGS